MGFGLLSRRFITKIFYRAIGALRPAGKRPVACGRAASSFAAKSVDDPAVSPAPDAARHEYRRVVQSLACLKRGTLITGLEGRYGATVCAHRVLQFGLWSLSLFALLIVASTVLLHRQDLIA